MHSKGYPQVDNVVNSDSCDQANEGEQLREIELLCEPGLPEGWEQCLDLEIELWFRNRQRFCGSDKSMGLLIVHNGQDCPPFTSGNGVLLTKHKQCINKTGEFFFIDKSCGKRTKRDPRPILVEANKNIHALWCPHSTLVDEDGATPSNNSHQDSRSSSTTVSSSMHILSTSMECSQSTEHVVKLPILKACSKCLLYFLIPREVEKCPSCKTRLFGV